MPSLKEDTTNHDEEEEEDETGFSTFGRMSVPASKYALRSEYSTGFWVAWVVCTHIAGYVHMFMITWQLRWNVATYIAIVLLLYMQAIANYVNYIVSILY